ncbi:MAG TPA: amidohydrolase family protein [Micromonosporaceae bacterium]|nr:amidohydrolase family protein [Micromonosporaceae bacterium]
MLAIRAGRVFDGERVWPDGALVFTNGGRITGIEPAGTFPPDGWPSVEMPHGTLLPGLIDTHVHLCGDGRTGALDRLPDYSEDRVTAVIAESLRVQLAAGVTTVRDLGDRAWAVLGWRAQAGGGPYPQIVAAGPPITSPAGHCWSMGGEVQGEQQLRQAVRERAERGADVVKIMASGGAMTAGTDVLACQFRAEELGTAVDEAHAAGLPITAHAHGLPAIEQALAAGVDGIEHCTGLTRNGIELPDRLLAALAAAGIAVCPTLGRVEVAGEESTVLERAGATYEARLEAVARMHRAGVRLVSGADAGITAVKPHGLLPEAVIDLVAAGIPAAEALASATSVAAGVCGLGDRKGRVRVGFDADLVLVDGDPIADPAALRRIAHVIVRGEPR